MDHDLIGVPSFNARGFLKIWYVRITAFATSIFMGSKLFGHTNIIVNINIFFTLGWESFDAFDGELSPWSFFCQSLPVLFVCGSFCLQFYVQCLKCCSLVPRSRDRLKKESGDWRIFDWMWAEIIPTYTCEFILLLSVFTTHIINKHQCSTHPGHDSPSTLFDEWCGAFEHELLISRLWSAHNPGTNLSWLFFSFFFFFFFFFSFSQKTTHKYTKSTVTTHEM